MLLWYQKKDSGMDQQFPFKKTWTSSTWRENITLGSSKIRGYKKKRKERSEVPQGSALRPLLFPILSTTCQVELYPLHVSLPTIVWSTGYFKNWIDTFQHNLDHLQGLELDWQITLNSDKSEVICIINKQWVIDGTYDVHGQILK